MGRWSARHNLVQFWSGEERVERHILEALAAAPLLGSMGRLLDVGSGAGLPGVPLLAVRPRWGGLIRILMACDALMMRACEPFVY